ncbi:hypothetical protein HJFPF1_03806 [Paramyrothecium foliicola]|nr:hypothetical protein HJFPF1_03806 [Paramyrothecium foliicola]
MCNSKRRQRISSPTTAMTSNNHTYRLRPGRFSDVAAATRLYAAAFRNDSLLNVLFPNHRQFPDDFKLHIHRLFEQRYWTPEFLLTMVVDETGHAVGCSWWRRPQDEFSVFWQWLSPYSWFSATVRGLLSLKAYFFPVRNIDQTCAGIYQRVFDKIKPEILNTTRRKQAWYLSILAVEPALQGRGFGSMLIRDGLSQAARRGKASYLVGLSGTDGLYSRFGFVQVARANVGELSAWDGGLIMFNE